MNLELVKTFLNHLLKNDKRISSFLMTKEAFCVKILCNKEEIEVNIKIEWLETMKKVEKLEDSEILNKIIENINWVHALKTGTDNLSWNIKDDMINLINIGKSRLQYTNIQEIILTEDNDMIIKTRGKKYKVTIKEY